MSNLFFENHDLSRAKRVDQVCLAFEAACKTAEHRRLEDWLRDAKEPDRSVLLKELILLEVHYRRQRGEAPGTDEYRQRFPELDESWLHQTLAGALETAADPDSPGCGNGLATVDSLPGTIHFAGDYALKEEIGRGGMGAVYRGHDSALGRTLAIKLLLEEHANNEELKRRFLEEAQIMGQLQHPGVAPIHEIGTLCDGRPFFSMRQIQGRTLAMILKNSGTRETTVIEGSSALRDDQSQPAEPVAGAEARSPGDLSNFLSIFEHVCQAVAYAHSQGILHRDLKPQNVMVGPFGEVQVMDWGLAKRIADCRLPAAGLPNSTGETLLENLRGTDPGQVLGTPAYMAPEQARGEVACLDERCDVFGLGAILCEILTGLPPFSGNTHLDSHRKAMKSDLQEAFTRLEGCCADAELRQLARRCLAAEKEGRPRHAGEVAAAMAHYQDGVRERLRRAEVERVEAQVKATEERKQRKIALTLAAVVVLFAVVAVGAGIWYYHDWAQHIREQADLNAKLDQEQTAKAVAEAERKGEIAVAAAKKEVRRQQLTKNLTKEFAEMDQGRAELQKQLASPLSASRLLSDLKEWSARVDSLKESWKRAAFFVQEGKGGLLDNSWSARLEELRIQIAADEKDWKWAKRLDDIRLDSLIIVAGKVNLKAITDKYLAAFQAMHLDVKKVNPGQLAKQVKVMPLRYALVAALDHWLEQCVDDFDLPSRLLKLANQADPDPWRCQVREQTFRGNHQELLDLAYKAQLGKQTPHITILLAHLLLSSHHNAEAVALLRQALLYHPSDFWLHSGLGDLVTDPKERADHYHGALAIRPDSAVVLNNLGKALLDGKDFTGALVCFQKAIKLDGNVAVFHYNLGIALYYSKDLNGAITAYCTAVQLDPSQVNAHINLGIALFDSKDRKGAIACFQKAIELDPNSAISYCNLGNALEDLKAALVAYHKAIQLDPMYAPTYYNLAGLLKLNKDLDGAIASYRKAVALDPNLVQAHYDLGLALYYKHEYDGAIIHYQKAIALMPGNAMYYSNLGLTLHMKKEYHAAIANYKTAIALDHNHKTPAYYNLANTLYALKYLDGAIACYRKTIVLQPRYAEAYCNMGHALRDQGHLAEALDFLKKGHELGLLNKNFKYPTATWVKHCERLLELDQKLPAILKGTAQPMNAAEQAELGQLCRLYKKYYIDSVDLFTKALKAEPMLAVKYRASAACAAVMAATGLGKDAEKLDKDEPAKLRQQALDWLKASLAYEKQRLQGNPSLTKQIKTSLLSWQKEVDLASVRDEKELARLPEAERQQWQAFWLEVEKTLREQTK